MALQLLEACQKHRAFHQKNSSTALRPSNGELVSQPIRDDLVGIHQEPSLTA